MYWGLALTPWIFRFYSCTGLAVRDDPEEDFLATSTSGIYHVILFPFASAFLYSDILSFIPVILHVYSWIGLLLCSSILKLFVLRPSVFVRTTFVPYDYVPVASSVPIRVWGRFSWYQSLGFGIGLDIDWKEPYILLLHDNDTYKYHILP
jgi:hypothetical protein